MEYLNKILLGDNREILKTIPDASVDCCVTSTTYYGLRDYGHPAQLGLETTPEEYIGNQVCVFEEVRRVLKPEGTLWLNVGDSYASGPRNRTTAQAISKSTLNGGLVSQCQLLRQINKITGGLKPKDLIGIPWMLAFALRGAGWYLRTDIIWNKKNCMPESVKDRPTRSHEFIFLLSKSSKYYYDADAIKEPAAERAGIRHDKQRGHSRRHAGFNDRWDHMTHEEQCTGMRNKRDVWHISPSQFSEAHFATFPEEIPEICIKAGCPVDGVVLNPFMGAGTTALVARKLQRNYFGIELNPEYIAIAERRLKKELGMFQ